MVFLAMLFSEDEDTQRDWARADTDDDLTNQVSVLLSGCFVIVGLGNFLSPIFDNTPGNWLAWLLVFIAFDRIFLTIGRRDLDR